MTTPGAPPPPRRPPLPVPGGGVPHAASPQVPRPSPSSSTHKAVAASTPLPVPAPAPLPAAPPRPGSITARTAQKLPLSRIPNAAEPVPSAEGVMSTGAKMSLADIALQLREEQIEARVIHYKAELATSPELDAITAQVVAELKALQKTASGQMQAVTLPNPALAEQELMATLRGMLDRLFRRDKLSILVKRRLGEVSKRFARLFFESELADKLQGRGEEAKALRYPDQALYHVLSRVQPGLLRELETFEYTSPRVLEDSKTILAGWIQELRNEFLARSTPELNALVKMLNEVMTRFLLAELPDQNGQLAWEVVKEAKLAQTHARSAYKVGVETFAQFRQAFETHFLQRLVAFAADEMLKRVNESEATFRPETLRFVADPHIYSDICEIVCDAVYDYLYTEGFLDLPNDWKSLPHA